MSLGFRAKPMVLMNTSMNADCEMEGGAAGRGSEQTVCSGKGMHGSEAGNAAGHASVKDATANQAACGDHSSRGWPWWLPGGGSPLPAPGPE